MPPRSPRARASAVAIALILLAFPAAAAPTVVASIKPIHSLAAAVMGDMGAPVLLVDGAESPHTYNLAPSDAQTLENADLVVWAGPALSPFLDRAVGQIAPAEASLALMAAPGVDMLENRVAGPWAGTGHDAGEAGEEGDARARDPHIWLDPDNAVAMGQAIADRLAALDPGRAERYAANQAALRQRIDARDAALAQQLAPVADRPYVVFHDAYQYFEAHYGLNAVGSLTLSPDRQPGAKRLQALRRHLAATAAVCVFREPQFPPDLVAPLIEGSDVRVAVLDPLGAELAPGPALYPALMQAMADNLTGCLAS